MLARVTNAATILVFAVATIVLVTWLSRTDDGPIASPDPESELLTAEFMKALRAGHRVGPAEAPVQILLYTVYECSFCRDFEVALKQARQRYPDHLAVTVRLFTSLETEKINLYLAAECAADQGVFEEFHAVAMRMRGPTFGVAGWTSVVDSISVPDEAALRRCVVNAEHANRIRVAHAEGQRLGVAAVPTFFVNGPTPHVGSLGFGELDSIVAAALHRRRSP